MVNGLGGTPISELYLLYGIAHQQLADQGIQVFRSYVNEYCTSLEMAGASITLLKVERRAQGAAARSGRDLEPDLLAADGTSRPPLWPARPASGSSSVSVYRRRGAVAWQAQREG